LNTKEQAGSQQRVQ